ncbi:hypothetical protein NKG05_09775 [Oerskovia sp. M15]
MAAPSPSSEPVADPAEDRTPDYLEVANSALLDIADLDVEKIMAAAPRRARSRRSRSSRSASGTRGRDTRPRPSGSASPTPTATAATAATTRSRDRCRTSRSDPAHGTASS